MKKNALIFISFFHLFNTCIFAQVQIGDDILDATATPVFGNAISMPDSVTVAVSMSASAGATRIYEWDGNDWTQKGFDIVGEATGDDAGKDISMPDANTIAIGAPGNDGSFNEAGHVRIYKWDGTDWIQKGEDIDGLANVERTGSAVSMPDSNTVAIGAPQSDNYGQEDGHVRVYEWTGSTWTQKGTDLIGEAEGDRSGWSISMPDAETVAIGAYNNSGSGFWNGHTRIYKWNGISWVQKGNDIDGVLPEEGSGFSVSMADSNTIAIGAPFNDTIGIVRLYEWVSNSWVQLGPDLVGDPYETFGFHVSMCNANALIVGNPNNDQNGTNSGKAEIYILEANQWRNIGTILGESTGHQLGHKVSMPSIDRVAVSGIGSVNFNVPGRVEIYKPCFSNNIDTSVTSSSSILSSNQTDGSFQWLDCGNGLQEIAGETGSSFEPSTNGSFAVQIMHNGCIDTSFCNTMNLFNCVASYSLYPDPTTPHNWFALDSSMGWQPITYEWNWGDGNSSIGANPSHTFDTAGYYNICLTITDAVGCTDTYCDNSTYIYKTMQMVTVSVVSELPNGIAENQFDKPVRYYPNPTSEKIVIDIGSFSDKLTINAYNTVGELVQTETITANGLIEYDMPTENGVYIVQLVYSDGGVTNLKVVKE